MYCFLIYVIEGIFLLKLKHLFANDLGEIFTSSCLIKMDNDTGENDKLVSYIFSFA